MVVPHPNPQLLRTFFSFKLNEPHHSQDIASTKDKSFFTSTNSQWNSISNETQKFRIESNEETNDSFSIVSTHKTRIWRQINPWHSDWIKSTILIFPWLTNQDKTLSLSLKTEKRNHPTSVLPSMFPHLVFINLKWIVKVSY